VFTTQIPSSPNAVDDESKVPGEYSLHQNYPNPFNPSTKIAFKVRETGFTSLKVYDVTGKEVTTLVNEKKEAGEYVAEFDARSMASGVYFYRLHSGGFTTSKKMLLLR
jgi:hypothetical protein